MLNPIASAERKRFAAVKRAFEEVTRAINGGELDPNVNLTPLWALPAADYDHPMAHRLAAVSLFRFMNVQTGGGTWNWKAATEFAKLAQGQPPHSPVRMMLGYMFATRALHGAIGSNGLGGGTLEQLKAVEQQLDGALAAAAEAYPAAAVYALQRAKVASLGARDRARELFRQAYADAPLFMDELGYDRGSHTYYEATELPPADYPGDQEIRRLRAALSTRPETHTTLVWSVDARFLRGYGPYWFHLAPYLLGRGLRLVFLVAGPDDTTTTLIADARALASNVAAFHGFPPTESPSVNFIPVEVPRFVAQTTTFYAVARFLFAGAIIAETGMPAITLDADMTLTGPLQPMLDKLVGDFGCPVSRGTSLLSPWRRYMAGIAFFSATPGAQHVLALLRSYVVHGLRAPISWMLDQNALTYAAEMTRDLPGVRFQNLSEIKRPVQADGTAGMIEARV